MSSNDESSNDEELSLEDDEEDDEEYFYDESSEGEAGLSPENRLFVAVTSDDADAAAAIVHRAIRDGANVNAVRNDTTPLYEGCKHGKDQIICILLDAGADAWWRNYNGWSAISLACLHGHFSTVHLLIHRDNGLLEIDDNEGWTPLFVAIVFGHPDIFRFLLDCGANPHHVDHNGKTTLMKACQKGYLDYVRLLLDAGMDVEARDEEQQTALHYAARRGEIEVARELILQHNANMFAVDEDGRTPFDFAFRAELSADVIDDLIELYGNKLTHDHDRLACHELLNVAEFSFSREYEFHPPLNPLRIILPLGKLTLEHLRTLLHTLDPELTHNRDDTGKVPIHIACQANAPVEVLAMLLELDPAALHIADSAGDLPIHLLCGTTRAAEYTSVRYLVEQGGVGTLAGRNQQGALPLHLLCGSINPPLRVVQYLIQSSPESLAVQTNDGQYPFMIAAAVDSSSASLSVIYELVRGNPHFVVSR